MFFTSTYTRNQGSRIEINIANSSNDGLEVNVYASECGRRTVPSQHWCFPGHICTIPTPQNHNFGDFYQGGNRDSPYLSTQQRLVIRAVDVTFTISQKLDIQTCTQPTSAIAPFCSQFTEITSRNFWGNPNTFEQKDLNAQELYQNLTLAFSCFGQTDHCFCPPLTPPCLRNLAIYSCLYTLGPCDSRGLEIEPGLRDCLNVESTCFNTFKCVGYSYLECDSPFYFTPPAPLANQTLPPPRVPGTRAPITPTNRPTTARPVAAPTFSPANQPGVIIPASETPEVPISSFTSYPNWITGAVIALIVLVAVLFAAVVIGFVVLAMTSATAAGHAAEIDAYHAL
jgi:hypothetical protein